MTTENLDSPRWANYYLNEDFEGFWTKRAGDPNVRPLLILGLGFDPRCLTSINSLQRLGFGDRLGYFALRLHTRPALGPAGLLTDELSNKNEEGLSLVTKCRCESLIDIDTQDTEGHNIAGRKVLEEISLKSTILQTYTDVIVDISGMPRGVFFPLVKYLIHLADKSKFQNLHVVIVEDSHLDAAISGREFGQADFIHTFRPNEDSRLVWLPVIGADERSRLEKIHDVLKGSCVEICPVLPFPARSLRRIDDVVIRHSELLFDSFLVDYDNLLLCDERSPFDVYRKILSVDGYYRMRLASITQFENVLTVVSPLSSKTLSLGVLLAAIERRLPVCHVEPGTYEIHSNPTGKIQADPKATLTEIWLTGEPYA